MKDVFEYVERNREKYIRWLQDICRQPSVAAQNRGMTEAANMVEALIRELGGEARQVETSGFPVVYGEFQGDKKTTLSFYNHYDVQPEDPVELWKSPPFGAEIHDGRMYARGVADNKGNLIARLAAVDAYMAVRGELPLKIKFLVEGEEEIGSLHLREFVDHNRELVEADGCIWEFGYKDADGRLQASFGVKGMCYVELVCRGANTDMHSSNAAVIENPAWRLIWALNTMKSPDEKVLINGFYDKVAPLTEADREALAGMDYDEEKTLKKFGLDSFVLGLSGMPLKEKLIYQPTCTVCGFKSGYIGEGKKTVLPSEASVKIDCRLVPDQDPHEICALIRRHLDEYGFSDIEIIQHTMTYPARTPLDSPLSRAVLKTAADIYGAAPTVKPMSPATGPMFVLCQRLGIPSVSVGVGHFASNNHAPNENIFIDDYIAGIKHIAAIIEDFPQRMNETAI
ncbi:M20/M25/M40 family metallo-hydrolase [Paenibacillus thalictri]|uniref:M20/M25/M40 family metallo-hydrolase n=1 Tax=Paenibacillus thalictri TaxID=2527873 RepID=A0A4Q9DRL8_9BACL|nr:M20/M25/M40 family metallo-hydrolase [Paenibacillus thalictri]TBL79447.1 M20/M25/M40 family metallo-hydrolase [Paenibacillus thalictri]